MSTAEITEPAATRKRRDETRQPADGADSAFCIPQSAWTLGGFREWTYSDDFPRHALIAYLGGEIFVDMSAEHLGSHGSVKVEVCTVLGTVIRRRKAGKFCFDRSRVAHESAALSNEPDALFASWKSFRTGKIRLVPTKDEDDFIELEGSPDWIMEIVSPGSVAKDTKKLRLRYYLAGIPEYWLIDARGKEVKFEVLNLGADEYEPAEHKAGWVYSKIFRKHFQLLRVKDPLGNWDYRLEMK